MAGAFAIGHSSTFQEIDQAKNFEQYSVEEVFIESPSCPVLVATDGEVNWMASRYTMGLTQQMYAKSHRILANCRGVKDFRRFRNSQGGPGLVGQFWGLDSDRILKLVLGEIILSQKIQMPPGSRRAMGDGLQQLGS